MPVIYLAGPISDGENPFAWHEAIQSEHPEVNWVNPFELNDHESEHEARKHAETVIQEDLKAVRGADAMLLRRISGYNLSGASVEAHEAYSNGIPVVVWNEGEGPVPLFLEGIADEVCKKRQHAIERVIHLAREYQSTTI